jgi:hypothetical protein
MKMKFQDMYSLSLTYYWFFIKRELLVHGYIIRRACLIDNVVVVALQIIFHVEIHANNFFIFLKLFLTLIHQNNSKHINYIKLQNKN